MAAAWESAPLADDQPASKRAAWESAPVVEQLPPTRAVLQQAVKVKPDTAAEVERLAKRYPAPYEVIERNVDDFQLFDAAEGIAAQLKQSPLLEAELRRSPRLAALAHDDVPALSKLEQALRQQRAERTAMGTVQDVAVTAVKGAVGLPQAFVGLASIATGGYAGKLAEQAGVRFADAQELLDTLYSPAQQQANETVREAEGFLDTLGAMLSNPSTIATTVGESVPQMLGGAAVGRAIVAAAPRIAPWLAAAIGEGVMGAGATAESLRNQSEDDLLTPRTTFAALGSGAGTALFGAAGARVAQRFGLGDIDTVLVARGLDEGSAALAKQSFIGAITRAGISEGVFEELPQSVQEQMWQNWGLGRPLGQGVGAAAAQGLLAGLAMGGGFQAVQNIADRMGSEQAQVDAAKQRADQLQQALKDAGAALLRERSPEQFRALMQTMTDGKVYVDGDVLNQLPPDALAALPEAVREQIPAAAAISTSVEIPVADILTIAPGTPLEQVLVENARVGDDSGMSKAEAEAAGQQAGVLMQEAERVIQQAADQDAMRASQEAVKANILGQLQAYPFTVKIKGRRVKMSDAVKEQYATWAAAFFTAYGSRAGMTPEQMYQRYPLRIVGEPTTTQPVMEQVGIDLTPGGGSKPLKIGDTTVDYGVSRDGQRMEIIMVKTPKAARGQGSARQALTQLLAAADARGMQVVLTAEPMDKSTSKAKLEAFYKSLGFVPNKGRNKDFTTMAGMIRPPTPSNAQAAGAGGAGVLNQPGNPAFDAWFGDSKVRDAEGKPLVVYHGTTQGDIFEFDSSTAAGGTVGVWTTSDPGYAAWLLKKKRAGDDAEPNVMPLYLSVQNPLVIDVEAEGRRLWKEMIESGRDVDEPSTRREAQTIIAKSAGGSWDAAVSYYAEQAQMDGLDGLVIRNFDDGYGAPTTAYIAFRPEQIKSAIGNNGAFDPQNPSILEQAAYHGTPHRGIDKFSTEFIGTGEGNQAYGWGLYFAGRKEIAEHYRKVLSSGYAPTLVKDGVELNSAADIARAYYQVGRVYNDYGGRDVVLGFTQDGPYRWSVQVQEVGADGQPKPGTRPRSHFTMPDFKDLERVLTAEGYDVRRGQLYEVEIPEDSEMLLWDKPLSEQPAKVREALREMASTLPGRWETGPMGERRFVEPGRNVNLALRGALDVSGEQFYRSLGEQRAASEALAALGIKGIKYLDGTSRAAGDGSYNYVIFSGDDVQIRNQFYQRAPRGPLATFNPRTLEIVLNPHANLSSFFHEAGHFFLEVLADIASQPDAPAQIAEDMGTFLKWAGITGDEDVGGADSGVPLAQSVQQTETPEFKRWFGDSKAVVAVNAETGEPVVSSREPKRLVPQVMYHTTRNDFRTFEVGRTTKNSGTFGDWETQRHAIFVTPEVEASQAYGTQGGRFATGANVMPLYVKAERPLDLANGVSEEDAAKLEAAGMSPRFIYNGLGNWAMFDDEGGAETVALIKKAGYDSVIFNDENPDTGDSFEAWALFAPEQIKSAIGNDGSFDANDPSILSQGAQPTASSTQPLPKRRTPLEVWNAMTLDQKRPYHERWAESIEQYVMEGRAPSVELQPLMRRFATWLKSVYGSIKRFLASRGQVAAGGEALNQVDPPAGFKTKAVDDSGRPAVVYHGTGAAFDKFNADGGKGKTSETGAFFTDDARIANTYAPDRPGAKVLPVYLELKNPFVVDAYGANWNNIGEGAFVEEEDGTQDDLEQVLGFNYAVDGPVSTDDIAAHARRKGYDGAIIRGVKDRGPNSSAAFGYESTVYVVFDPKQIVSAISGEVLGQDPTAQPGPPMALNDDIRRVMDRMLATDEQIAQANEVAGLVPDEDADALASERLRKRSIADLKWSVKARDQVIAKLRKQAAAIENDIREQVTAEVDATPEMRAKRALDALQVSPEYAGMLAEHKAARKAAETATRAEVKAALLADNPDAKGLIKGQLLAKNKRDIENKVEAAMIRWDQANPAPKRPVNATDADVATIADSFGFEGVDAMMQAIDAFGSRRDAIDGITERRMLEEHGDLVDERAIQQAANEAVHNEARARSLATELRTQAEMLNKRRQVGVDAEADALLSITQPITPEDATALVAGKTEKPGGVDPQTWIGNNTGNEYRIGDVPLDLFVDNEEGDRYDGTVDPKRAAEYAAREPAGAPPVIATQGRKGGKLRVIDGGHRVTAARMRGDKTIRALVRVKTKETANGSKITVNALVEAAKQFAANVVGKTIVRDLKSKAWQHTAAERRAAKRWQEATAAGKTEDAVKAKQDQMLNHAAAKAAMDAQTDAQKILDFFRRVTKGNDETVVEKGRDADIVNAARAVLKAYGVESPTSKRADDYLELVSKNDPETFNAIKPMVDAATQNAQPLDALTYDELQVLHEHVKAMWFLAKRRRQMEVDGNLLDIDDAADELSARMEQIGIPDRIPGEGRAVTFAEDRALFLQQGIAFLRRVEQWAEGMDGKYGGPFLRYTFQPVKAAADRYRADRIAYRKKFQALVDNLAPIIGNSVIEAPELGTAPDGKPIRFGEPGSTAGTAMNEILHAILHTGNESNKRKLLLGRGWATESADGTLDTSKWDAFIQRLVNEGKLERAHYDFVQGVWDLMEETKGDSEKGAQKAYRDAFGRYFAEVTAQAFVDPFGVPRAGGYVPAQVDPRQVSDNKLKKLAEEENNAMAFAFPQPAKGFTMARVEGYTRPLMLDLRTLSQHIDKVLLFSHMTVPVRDVRKLLTNKKVGQPLDRIQPAAIESMLTPWLARSAQQVVETPVVGAGKWARIPGLIRARAGMALMFANVSNSIQQITGLSSAAVLVKPSHLMRAMAQHVAHPVKAAQAVWAVSPYMDDRAKNEVAVMNEQMQDILIRPSIYQRAQSWSMRHAYFMQTAVDNALSPIVWTGAYNQALADGQAHDQAVQFADSVVRRTQGSTLPEDVSRLETGPAYARVFTQFVSYFNMMANTNGTAIKNIANEVGLRKGAGKALGVVLLGLMIPIWVAEAIAIGMRGGPEDEDDDGYLDDWLAAVFGFGTVKGLLAQIPIIGQFGVAAANRFNDNPLDDRVSMSPAISLLESSVGAPESVYKAIVEDGSAQKAIRDVATLVSVGTGIPVYGLARPLGYAAGVAQGRIEPTGPGDAARGLITGTASPDSKQR